MDHHMIASDGVIYDCGSPAIAPNSNTVWINVQVEGHEWWSTRYGNMTVKDFIVVVQRNACRLGFIEKDDSIQSLKLARVDGNKVVDLDLEDTLYQVKLCMSEDLQLVAVVLNAKVTTASEATSMSMVQLWPFGNKSINCKGQDSIDVDAHEHPIFDSISVALTDSEIHDNLVAVYSSPSFPPIDMSLNEDATSDNGDNNYDDDNNRESDHDSHNDGDDESDINSDDNSDYHNQARGNNNKPRRRNQEVLTPILTISDLTRYFELKKADAANELDVSISSLKRKCRQLGLKCWPTRKINKFTNTIRGLEDVIAAGGYGRPVEDLTKDCNMLKDAKRQFFNGDLETINKLTKNKDAVPVYITKLLYTTGWRAREK